MFILPTMKRYYVYKSFYIYLFLLITFFAMYTFGTLNSNSFSLVLLLSNNWLRFSAFSCCSSCSVSNLALLYTRNTVIVNSRFERASLADSPWISVALEVIQVFEEYGVPGLTWVSIWPLSFGWFYIYVSTALLKESLVVVPLISLFKCLLSCLWGLILTLKAAVLTSSLFLNSAACAFIWKKLSVLFGFVFYLRLYRVFS